MPDTALSPKLLVRAKDGASEERELAKTEFTIGRKPDNDLVLDDSTVSGHHARICKIQAAFFIEDLQSTNGTQVNGQPVERRQLQDADVIAVGHFRLVYRGDVTIHPACRATAGVDLDQTMALTRRTVPEALKKTTPAATLHILSGSSAEDSYSLTKEVTTIGAKHDAAIRLTGWFAPKVAAIITKRGADYVLTPSGSGKRIRINDEPVKTPMLLEDGDRIEVAGLTVRFSLPGERKAA